MHKPQIVLFPKLADQTSIHHIYMQKSRELLCASDYVRKFMLTTRKEGTLSLSAQAFGCCCFLRGTLLDWLALLLYSFGKMNADEYGSTFA